MVTIAPQTRKHPLRRLILELSRNCNLHCSMCGFGGHPIKSDWFMPSSSVKKCVIDTQRITQLHEIRLNGRGESTIHPEFVSLLRFIRSSAPNAQLTLFTNLMFPDDAILYELNDAKVLLFISMDSSNQSNFERIRSGASFKVFIERLFQIDHGYIVFTLQELNWKEIADVAEIAKQNNLGFIINNIHLMDESARKSFKNILNANWGDFLAQLEYITHLFDPQMVLIPDQILGIEIPLEFATTVSCGELELCPNAHTEVMVSYMGEVFPCNMFHPQILGYLSEQSLSAILKSSKRRDFLKSHKNSKYCQNCAYLFQREEILR